MDAELRGGPWDGRSITVDEPPPLGICTNEPRQIPDTLPDGPYICTTHRYRWNADQICYVYAGPA